MNPAMRATVLFACLAAGSAAGASSSSSDPTGVLVGPVTRAQVEAAVPDWVGAEVSARPDAAAIHDLATVPPGAEVTVLLGTWCSDSRREISRLWRALDALAEAQTADLPFTVRYVAVDEAKREPAATVAECGLRYLPTIVVRRDGREVGRIVEVSPHGVESDLLALLSGKASGLLSASRKLTPPVASGASRQPPR